jgi:peptidoglycan L-alanyl-D-glutamate endopeptidase CwlK
MALTERDMTRMNMVHPALKSVVLRAYEIYPHFFVLEGVRSRETCMVNYGKGRTAAQLAVHRIPASYAQPKAAKVTWLKNPFNSKHCIQDSKYGEAIDLAPVPLDWNNLKAFDAINAAMQQAARELRIDIRWGADWDEDGRPRERGESDSPHWELG